MSAKAHGYHAETEGRVLEKRSCIKCQEFLKPSKVSDSATPHCYLTRKIGAHLQVPGFPPWWHAWSGNGLLYSLRGDISIYQRNSPLPAALLWQRGCWKGPQLVTSSPESKVESQGACSSARSHMLTLGWAFAGVLSFLFYSRFTQRLRRWLWSKVVNRLTSLPRDREWSVGRVSLRLTLSSQLWRWKFLPLKGVNISLVDRIHVSSSFWFTKHWVESNFV